MRVQLFLAICLLFNVGNIPFAQDARVVPNVASVSIAGGTVTLLHLAPGYTTSVKLPEEVSSVVIGDPASFKAEHSDSEPRLVFLKPITEQPADSNALITTKSGQENLTSFGEPGQDGPASVTDALGAGGALETTTYSMMRSAIWRGMHIPMA